MEEIYSYVAIGFVPVAIAGLIGLGLSLYIALLKKI